MFGWISLKRGPKIPKTILFVFSFVVRRMQPVQNMHWPGLLPPVQPQFWQPGEQRPMVPSYQAPPGPVSLRSLSTGVPSASMGSGPKSYNCDNDDDDQCF